MSPSTSGNKSTRAGEGHGAAAPATDTAGSRWCAMVVLANVWAADDHPAREAAVGALEPTGTGEVVDGEEVSHLTCVR